MKNKEVEQREIEAENEMNKFYLKEGYPQHIQDLKIKAIGWLDISEPFEKGEVPKGFLTKLMVLWREGLILSTLGCHLCEFCEEDERATSSKEKILIDKENKVKYIFPEMIFHYIEIHKYLPPIDFIKFVMEHN